MFRAHSAIRRFLFTAAVLILSLSLGAQEQSTDYDQEIIKVLQGYQELFSEALDDDVEDLPGFSWYVVGQAINQGFLRFTVDPVTDTLLRGARFHAEPGSDVTHIILTRNLVDLWETSPSTTYSILTRSVRDAANFFRDPPVWGAAQNDSLELLMMRVDQYNVEGLLIRDRLLPGGYLLSPYESYILDSFEKDGLGSVIAYLERHSLPVSEALYKTRLSFEQNNDVNGLRDFLVELGNGLLDSRNATAPGSDDEVVYPQAVAIHSWLEFTPYLISRIHNRNRQDNPLTFDKVLELEASYSETRRKLEASRTRDMPILNKQYADTIRGFEKLQVSE